MTKPLDAIVIGSGPNGLTAAITLAQAGLRVQVWEAASTAGGGMRTQELTLPGFFHDVCSAVHPLAVASPVFQKLGLEHYGLEWIQPRYPLAHPLDNGRAIIMERDIAATADRLGEDGPAYRKIFAPLTQRAEDLLEDFLQPLHLPKHPILFASFGLKALQSARRFAEGNFRSTEARALFAGLAAHSFMALDEPASAAVALMLAVTGHAHGWPIPRGGSQSLASALVACLQKAGGELITGHRVERLDELPPSRFVFFDVTPQQLLTIAGHQLPESYKKRLQRFQYGPGIFKLDWALAGPVPWQAIECQEAATLHLGGRFEEIAASEAAVRQGRIPDRPYVLLAQPSLFDAQRTPDARHTLWAYCHVPAYAREDMRERIEAQIERFAPGFQRLILARSTLSPADMERYNGNYIGGSISGGLMSLQQTLARPRLLRSPYRTPNPRLILCSSSTPPGPGVHGMCGFHAAQEALASL